MSVQNLKKKKNMSNGKKRKATIDVGNIKSNDISQGIAGAIYGLGIAFEVVAFYSNSHDILLRQKKIDILKRLREKHN